MDNEHRIAESYRKTHYLARPRTSILHVILYCLIFKVLSLSFSAILVFFAKVPGGLWLWDDMITLVLVFAFAKQILLTLIECYQHYAPEHVRRKCVFMPSCSMYAMLAIHKYNLFKAVHMIIGRLNRCNGPVCSIDYP